MTPLKILSLNDVVQQLGIADKRAERHAVVCPFPVRAYRTQLDYTQRLDIEHDLTHWKTSLLKLRLF